jgi:hypothetical protein
VKYFFVIILSSICQVTGSDIHSPILTINSGWRNETIITVDAQTHIDYGLAYPVTYEFIIPAGSDNLQSYHRFQATQDWSQIVEKTTEDFFNGIEAVRFDYDENTAYVSVGFSEFSDSIYIKLTDNDGNNIDATYSGMSQYYDNRDAAVTATADDWAGWVNDKFIQTCLIFRSYNLWLSCAIVTDVGDPNTWVDIQTQLDSGYVEAISHSRTHPYAPYDDLEGEVLGSMQDLIDNLDLPAHNRSGIHEYVYAWVAPYGEYDDAIDSMVSVAKYFVTRMYYGNDYGFSNWDHELYKYDPIGVSREVGPLWLGTTDTADLNNTFDEVLLDGGVYHVMCHPNVIEWDQDYPWIHLEHISNRNNVWYTGFGHLYAYHFLQSTYPEINLHSMNPNEPIPEQIVIHQNYPNPFNPSTTISFFVPTILDVKITAYNVVGNEVSTLLNKTLPAGMESVIWNAQDQPSGVYFIRMQSGDFIETQKVMLLK